MKIKFIQVGKTDQDWLKEGVEVYKKRLSRYISFESLEIPLPTSKLAEERQLLAEAEKVLMHIKASDFVVLLDDKGLACSSVGLAQWLNKKFVNLQSDLVFICGGAYGFHETLKSRANENLSLSPMTFTHQMVRLIFTEQLYRAMTILRNEPYHHS